jgi:hypothetical protein
VLRNPPGLHGKLKRKNLDVLYCLAEEELAPFVNFTTAELQDPRRFTDFVKQLEGHLQ